MRDATFAGGASGYNQERFNPRVPCGTRPYAGSTVGWVGGFNPRVPCGTRPSFFNDILYSPAFQSTRPVRDATCNAFDCCRGYRFQSTRPVRDATVFCRFNCSNCFVSIHASRAGRDLTNVCPPRVASVSIHASRAGRDIPFFIYASIF